MANEKVFQSRIQLKHDIEENWSKATNFIPKVGEIIIYDIDENNSIARFKIGDGITNINSLPFVSHHEVISYLPQELTEEQQMQARANLGVYSTTLPIIEEGTIEIVNKQGYHFLSLEESTNIKLTLSAIVDHNSRFEITLTGYSSYNSNHMYLRMEASDDFRYNLIYEGDFWDFSNSGYDLPDGTYNFSLMKIQTLLVPEEYIPDTIARASDIPQNVVQYSEQTLSEKEQMQARANLGLYYNKETLLETGELIFNEKKSANICFHEINNESHNNKYCKLVLKKDNYNVECYGIVEARLFSQAFLLQVSCSFTGEYSGKDFTADYSCVESDGRLVITKVYSGAESNFVSSTWNYELYLVEQNSIPENFLPIMTGATVDRAGTKGIVPAPDASDEEKFLANDGTWKKVKRTVTGKEGQIVGFDSLGVNIAQNPEELVFNQIAMIDQITGYKYIIEMRNGNLVSFSSTNKIEVTSLPNITTYSEGNYFNPEGLVISAICEDGTTREITNYTYSKESLTMNDGTFEILYVENGVTHSTTIELTIVEFNPSVKLIDFEYTDNGDGTYTITGWKETLNGEPSTEMIIPNNSLIIL